jgi:hypothetical protein
MQGKIEVHNIACKSTPDMNGLAAESNAITVMTLIFGLSYLLRAVLTLFIMKYKKDFDNRYSDYMIEELDPLVFDIIPISVVLFIHFSNFRRKKTTRKRDSYRTISKTTEHVMLDILDEEENFFVTKKSSSSNKTPTDDQFISDDPYTQNE